LNRTPGQFDIRIVALKEQVRAGTVSSHYISDNVRLVASKRVAVAEGGWRRKWWTVALVAAGAAGGGLAVAMLSGSAPAVGAPGEPQVSIGPPTITVGRP
jgi:hypothetical protein